MHAALMPQVAYQLLGTGDGCELYLVAPTTFGFRPGDLLPFAEVQGSGRRLGKTVIGILAGGAPVLAPGEEWAWHVGEGDKVVVIAEDW